MMWPRLSKEFSEVARLQAVSHSRGYARFGIWGCGSFAVPSFHPVKPEGNNHFKIRKTLAVRYGVALVDIETSPFPCIARPDFHSTLTVVW